MKVYGLIGNPLGHSFSKDFFEEKFLKEHYGDCVYYNFQLQDINELPSLIRDIPGLSGLNVTSPFKTRIIPFLDETDAEATIIGAVNCIKFNKIDGKTVLTGLNTDHKAFEITIKPLIGQEIKKALILGTGGASRAVAHALQKLGITPQFVSRIKSDTVLTYPEIHEGLLREHLLVINATPSGMAGFPDEVPEIPYELLTPGHVLYDLVYNPPLTRFLEKGLKAGCIIKNGDEMLRLQAELSWDIWNSPPER